MHGERVHYPLVATPVAIGYDPESATITVTPQGPPRLQLRDKLAEVAPQWAVAVDAGGSAVLPADGAAAARAWRWRQAQTWFDEVVGSADPTALGQHAERCRERIRRLTQRDHRAAEEDEAAPERRCESDFELAVWRRLTAHGLRPVVRYPIGGYRIDFVLAAPDGRRLAIECDGDGFAGPEAFARDLRRQSVLERVGNCVFVRLRASRFHRDPDVAMRPVWDRVDELGIRHSGAEDELSP